MDLAEYRAGNDEQKRIRSLLELIPEKAESALDVGARDGYITRLLTDYFETVTALDLVTPCIEHGAVVCLQGNAKALQFPDNFFDLVLCAEVLEHIPPEDLSLVCSELARVSRKGVIIGVPYKQDSRIGRTTCAQCGTKNPAWGHVNTFDEHRLRECFPSLAWHRTDYVGETKSRTNPVSVFLFDIAGNPYGTYQQDEVCVHCQNKVGMPPALSLFEKIASRLGHEINRVQSLFLTRQPKWINVYFAKNL